MIAMGEKMVLHADGDRGEGWTMSRRRAGTAAVVLMLVAGGCGGGGDSKVADTPTKIGRAHV